MPITASQIAEQVQGEVIGDGAVELLGFAAADKAREGDLTFAEKEIYFANAERSHASAILVSGPFTSLQQSPHPSAKYAGGHGQATADFFPARSIRPGHPS